MWEDLRLAFSTVWRVDSMAVFQAMNLTNRIPETSIPGEFILQVLSICPKLYLYQLDPSKIIYTCITLNSPNGIKD